MPLFYQIFWWSLALLLATPAVARGATPEKDGVEYFESKIRPILVDTCYQCHSQKSEKIKGGLVLDTKEGLLKGGETGPGLVPGDPEKSLLIKAVRYADENLQMPPKNKKLSAEQIAALETWVKMGAPDPRTGPAAATTAELLLQKASAHWAFKPISHPAPPEVKTKKWGKTAIDQFVLAKLEEKKLKPNPMADKRTLLRRATYDLTGLSPTPEQLAAFQEDKSTNAFAKVVDRLLASPEYGERWARLWLDVARYADTKGYVFQEERRYPYAYTYRDYVIEAFNQDLPFDQFIKQQLAADLMPLGEDKRPLAALGYLTLGRRFLNNQPDIIDDRIDVVTRGMMGLTVTCARCHDHKFDPVPTKDYYSLYGIFASCSEPAEKPLLGQASFPKEYPEYVAEKAKREKEKADFDTKNHALVRATLRDRAGDYLLTAFEAQKISEKSKAENLAKERKLDNGVVQRWIKSLEKWKQETNSVFVPWFAFSELNETDLTNKFDSIITNIPAASPLVVSQLTNKPPASLKDLAKIYGQIFRDAEKSWTNLVTANTEAKKPAPTKLEDAMQENIRMILYAEESPANIPAADIPRLYDVPVAEKTRALRRKIEELDATHPGAPPRAMVLNDNSTPYTPHVFIRGSQHNQGPEVPRQFLEIVAGKERKPFTKGSGRLEMAESIASKDNPLTARVAVNRVWIGHFGAGLVRTPSDFGLRADPPTHPELLDYLASEFIEGGWSIKKLHRSVMLSAVYQQGSDNQADYATQDPANLWLWKMNRRRLDFETTRDTLLQVSGKLDLRKYGQPVEITQEPFPNRRTIYGFIDRQNLPGLFRTFDFASPDATSPQRFNTTVPQQALFMINSPFTIEQAKQFLLRPEVKAETTPQGKINKLYRVAFQRDPEAEELEMGLKFIKNQSGIAAEPVGQPVWSYGYGEYDEVTDQIVTYTPFPHFTGDSWQFSGKIPDEKMGYVFLKNDSGHTGVSKKLSPIRRWTSPASGTFSFQGELRHDSDSGDGVRGAIVSNHRGELGSWVSFHGKVATELGPTFLEEGEVINFVVDCRGNNNSDTFFWAPTIKAVELTAKDPMMKMWDAKADFAGPPKLNAPLSPWEKYAQVLLMSNELAFAD